MKQISESQVKRSWAIITMPKNKPNTRVSEIEVESLIGFVVPTTAQTASQVIADTDTLRLSLAYQQHFDISEPPEIGGTLSRALDRDAQRLND